jgi:hypothetical protein
VLIGIIADIDADAPTESSITYGVASRADLGVVEAKLGVSSLDKAFDDGVMVLATVRRDQVIPGKPVPPRILISIDAIPKSNEVYSLSCHPGWASLPPSDLRAVYWSASAGQRRQKEAFVAGRTAALALRKRWDIEQMRHRGDWCEWVPGWVKNTVKDTSRQWLELQNFPPIPPALPPIPSPLIAEPVPMSAAIEEVCVKTPSLLSKILNLGQ